jgi:gliding motility-associated-like protein
LPIQYEWSDASGQTTATAIGLPEDVYSVTVTDNIGCTLGFLATVDPTEDCLFIADAITPNGDGINDRWVVGGLEFFPQSEVEVFNRWGQLIFRSKPGTTWWDGTFNGALLPASDYYYVISLEPGAQPITGTVTLKY